MDTHSGEAREGHASRAAGAQWGGRSRLRVEMLRLEARLFSSAMHHPYEDFATRCGRCPLARRNRHLLESTCFQGNAPLRRKRARWDARSTGAPLGRGPSPGENVAECGNVLRVPNVASDRRVGCGGLRSRSRSTQPSIMNVACLCRRPAGIRSRAVGTVDAGLRRLTTDGPCEAPVLSRGHEGLSRSPAPPAFPSDNPSLPCSLRARKDHHVRNQTAGETRRPNRRRATDGVCRRAAARGASCCGRPGDRAEDHRRACGRAPGHASPGRLWHLPCHLAGSRRTPWTS